MPTLLENSWSGLSRETLWRSPSQTAGIIRLSEAAASAISYESPRPPPNSTDEGIADRPESAEDLTERIDELEQEGHTLRARIKRLQDAGKTVIAQREAWKSRALAAEELLESERNRHSRRSGSLRRTAPIGRKELHPDFCTGGQLEKLMRQECFKKLWPEIERLAEQR